VAGPSDRRARGSEGLSGLAQGYQKAAPYLAASTSLVAAVGVFTGIGVWLDGRWGTSPWLTLLGAIVGMTGGFISFFKTVLGKRTKKP
jgi:F0F1-type ATP synthase assembly protein I